MSLLRVSNRPCAQVWCGREATDVGLRTMEGVRKVQAKMEGVAKVHAVGIQALPSAHIQRTFIQRYTRHTRRRTGR